jgi:hypothetical protein
MMSLNTESGGGWNRSDDLLTRYSGNYQDKIEANIDEIEQRINAMGITGFVKQVFYNKCFRAWASGTMEVDYFLSLRPVRKNMLHEFLSISGRYHVLYVAISMLYWFILMLLVFVASIKCYVKKTFDKMAIIFMPLLMLALFLLIWESNARYLLNMIPLIIICGVYGIDLLLNFSYKCKDMYLRNRQQSL